MGANNEQEIRSLFDESWSAVAAGNGAAACEHLTVELQQEVATEGDSCADVFTYEPGDAYLERIAAGGTEVLSVNVEGDTAIAEVREGDVYDTVELRKEGGKWLITAFDAGAAAPPDESASAADLSNASSADYDLPADFPETFYDAPVLVAGSSLAGCLTLDQVREAWMKGTKVRRWGDLPHLNDEQFESGAPRGELELYGLGDGTTYLWFGEGLFGVIEPSPIRRDYNNFGVDSHTVMTGVAGSPSSLGFVSVRSLLDIDWSSAVVDIGNGTIVVPAIEDPKTRACVPPTPSTVASFEYPLLAET